MLGKLDCHRSVGLDGSWIDLDRASAVFGRPSLQIEPPVVEWAHQAAGAHDAVGQRATLVRAVGLGSEDLAISGAEDRDAPSADFAGPPFSLGDLLNGGDLVNLSHVALLSDHW